jgi:TP901 family phage tail tape measure protein
MAVKNRDIVFILKMKNAASAAMRRMGKDWKDIAKEAKAAQTSIRGVDNETSKARRSTVKFGRDGTAAMGGMATKIRVIKSEMLSLQSVAGKVGIALAAAFSIRAIAAVGRDLIQTYARFEQQMAAVAAVSNATDAEMQKLIDTAKQLGATTEFTGKQAGAGLEFLVRAGFSANAAIEALPATLDLATAAAIDLGRSADIVSNIMSTFSIPVEDTARATDILATVNSSANTNILQLAEAMKYAGSVTSGFGISLNETAAAIGVLGDRGIQGSLAGTAVRMATIRGKLVAVGQASKTAQNAFAAMGIDPDTFDPEKVGIIGMIKSLKEAGASQEQLLAIFGARAAGPVDQLIRSYEKLGTLTQKTISQTGEAARQAAAMRDTLTGDWKALRSAIEGAFIAIGENIGPSLRAIVQLVTSVVQAMQGAEVTFERFSGSANAIATAIGLAGKAIKAFLVLFVFNKVVGATRILVAFGARLGLLVGVSVAAGGAMGTLKVAMLALRGALRALLGPIGLLMIAFEGLNALSNQWASAEQTAENATKGRRIANEELTKALEAVDQASVLGRIAARNIAKGHLEAALAANAVAKEEAALALARAKQTYDDSWNPLAVVAYNNALQNILNTLEVSNSKTREIQAQYLELNGQVLSDERARNMALEEINARKKAELATQAAIAAATAGDVAKAQELLAKYQQQAEMSRTILRYGKDSVQVTALREAREAAVLAKELDQLQVTQQVRDQIMAAAQQARAFAGVDMTGGLRRALLVAYKLQTAIARAMSMANAASGGLAAAGAKAIGNTAIGQAVTNSGGVISGLVGKLTDKVRAEVNARGGVQQIGKDFYDYATGLKGGSSKTGGGGGGSSNNEKLVTTKTIVNDILAKNTETVRMAQYYGNELKIQQALVQAVNAAKAKGLELSKEELLQVRSSTQAVIDAQAARETIQSYGTVFKDSLTSGLKSALDNGRLDMASFVSDLGKKLRNTAIDNFVKILFEGGGKKGGGIMGWIGNLFGGGGGGGFLGNLFKNLFADGGIMSSAGRVPIKKYSSGGIAKSPQMSIFGEGSVPEAYVPVPSGRIPVQITGNNSGNGGGNTIHMTVVTKDAESFNRSQPQIMADMQREMNRQGQRNN